MYEFLTSDLVGKYPILQFLTALFIIAGGLYAIYRGEQSKRGQGSPPEDANRVVTMLDLARFEAELEEKSSARRKVVYDKIETIGMRITTCETHLDILLRRRK